MARLFAALVEALHTMRAEAAETLAAPRYFNATPINHATQTWSE